MDTEKATVRDYMTKDVFTVKYDTLNNDVIKLMKQTKHDGYPVVDELLMKKDKSLELSPHTTYC